MIAMCLLFSIGPKSGVAAQSTIVSVSGRQLLVGGQPFFVKGVGYSPVPLGVDPEQTPPYGDYFTSNYSNLHQRDLPLLRSMGANVVRLWGWDNAADHSEFLTEAYHNGVDPIRVIVTFFMSPALYPDISSNAGRSQVKLAFRNMVAAHKNSPAVLMWAIGNELNAPWNYGNNLGDLFSLMNEMAVESHQEEGTGAHPVTSPLLDSNLLSVIATYDNVVPNLDVWSANIYRGSSFGSFFSDYATRSTKPFAVLEFGIDSYDDRVGMEYEAGGTPQQALYAQALYQELVLNSSITIGGTIMAYSDEWWKGKNDHSRGGCPDTDPAVHSPCGYATASHPDGYANEEWWGVMRTVKNGSSADVMQPRAVYSSLQSLWLTKKRGGQIISQ